MNTLILQIPLKDLAQVKLVLDEDVIDLFTMLSGRMVIKRLDNDNIETHPTIADIDKQFNIKIGMVNNE